MPSDLERQLEGFLGEAPQPDAEVEEYALARAVAALEPAASHHRRLRAGVFAFAAVVVLLAVTAGALAATGALHVSFGKPKPAATTPLTLPHSAAGVLAVVDGRLSVVTKSGFRLQGLPVSAAALSPHALYVAAGIGDSLVALEPNGQRAWSHPAGGTVVAIAWAPDGFRIAYVVRVGHRLVLHAVYGNGTHETVIDRAVRAVLPSWRADSLAFAYVGAGGHAIVYDLAHRSHRVVEAGLGDATELAFAPSGDDLAVGGVDGVSVVQQSGHRRVARGNVEAFGWLRDRLAVATRKPGSALIRLFASDGAARGSYRVRGTVVAITPRLVVVRKGQSLLAGRVPLLTVPLDSKVRGLQVG